MYSSLSSLTHKQETYIMSYANTQPHQEHCFLRFFNKYKSAFTIEKIQIHEKKNHPGCLACTISRTKGSCLASPEKNVRKNNALLGEEKASIFPNVYTKSIDLVGGMKPRK